MLYDSIYEMCRIDKSVETDAGWWLLRGGGETATWSGVLLWSNEGNVLELNTSVCPLSICYM
jgi:hypothetical protein